LICDALAKDLRVRFDRDTLPLGASIHDAGKLLVANIATQAKQDQWEVFDRFGAMYRVAADGPDRLSRSVV
jgi:hypothetical protein